MNRYSVTVLLAGCLAVHLTACGTASAAPTPMPEPTAAPTENPES